MRIFLEYLKVGLWMLPIILPALWLLPRLSKRYAARVSYVIWLVLAVRAHSVESDPSAGNRPHPCGNFRGAGE